MNTCGVLHNTHICSYYLHTITTTLEDCPITCNAFNKKTTHESMSKHLTAQKGLMKGEIQTPSLITYFVFTQSHSVDTISKQVCIGDRLLAE